MCSQVQPQQPNWLFGKLIYVVAVLFQKGYLGIYVRTTWQLACIHTCLVCSVVVAGCNMVRVCGMFLCLTCADSVDICVPCNCAPWSGSGPTGRCRVLSDYSINSDYTVSGAFRLDTCS